MTGLLTALAVLAGAMLPVQAAINARLARDVGSPLWAAALSGLVLTVTLAAGAMVATRAGPRLDGAASVPWWAWTGGLCGAVVLSATTAAAPLLGTATMVALVMAGQMVASLLLDRFGALGLDTHPMTAQRSVATLLVLVGAALMR